MSFELSLSEFSFREFYFSKVLGCATTSDCSVEFL